MTETIAIIEDEQNIVELVKYNLDREGYTTISANNGRRGLDLVRQELPDLVILDLMMPEMDGLTAIKLIREYDSKAKIIVCSAMGQKDIVLEAIQAGAKNFIVKPYDAQKVADIIKAVMG